MPAVQTENHARFCCLSLQRVSEFLTLCDKRPHVQPWLSWSEGGTVNPQVVGWFSSKTREFHAVKST